MCFMLINAQGRQDGDGQYANGHQNPVRNPRQVACEQLNLTYSNILILRMAQLL